MSEAMTLVLDDFSCVGVYAFKTSVLHTVDLDEDIGPQNVMGRPIFCPSTCICPSVCLSVCLSG